MDLATRKKEAFVEHIKRKIHSGDKLTGEEKSFIGINIIPVHGPGLLRKTTPECSRADLNASLFTEAFDEITRKNPSKGRSKRRKMANDLAKERYRIMKGTLV